MIRKYNIKINEAMNTEANQEDIYHYIDDRETIGEEYKIDKNGNLIRYR